MGSWDWEHLCCSLQNSPSVLPLFPRPALLSGLGMVQKGGNWYHLQVLHDGVTAPLGCVPEWLVSSAHAEIQVAFPLCYPSDAALNLHEEPHEEEDGVLVELKEGTLELRPVQERPPR